MAVLLGGLILTVTLVATYRGRATDFNAKAAEYARLKLALADEKAVVTNTAEEKTAKQKQTKEAEKKLESVFKSLHTNPFKNALAKVGSWKNDPRAAFFRDNKPIYYGLLGAALASMTVFGIGAALNGENPWKFSAAFIVLFAFAVISYVLAGQEVIKNYNLEYALWAILIGMIISNTIGTPAFLKPALRTELYIKTGLVLLGAEILLSRLLVLGLPGIFVSWVVTPITLITTYAFGQYVLRMSSRSLNMVISADMSVCGVSAAIATAAACRAKKEELSLAIGLSLAFTVVMMVVMPMFIRAVGMNDVLAGAWLGGTIDSTGAVAAAGGMISPTALEVAATVKMIQNILIGAVAFGVAVYWVMYVEKSEDRQRPGISEIWLRFPKFVLGFVGASIVFSAIYSTDLAGQSLTESTISGTTEILRGWFFCLAFVSIGLETNFRELSQYMKGGKPLVLYVCGQALNLALTLLMAWVMFEKVFPHAAEALSK
uniref:YeiH family protein n=1 Tax=Anatilimnocola floriformis TaxID=2948575 RepID=UPI0020C36BB7|nr:putative sulfate exporter family transporter [Anatilimnocola floriformis]